MDEHFFLQWEDFHGNLKSSYTELRENYQFTDVTLCCEGGQQVKAHKIILSATSSLLNDILIQNDHIAVDIIMEWASELMCRSSEMALCKKT